MLPVIEDADHVWVLSEKHDPIYYANLLTDDYKLELSETSDDSIVVRSTSGTSDYYNIVEITREEHGVIGGGELTARFQHDDSPRTDVAERILEDYMTDTLDP